MLQDLAQRAPLTVASDAQIDMSVLCGDHPHRGHGGVIITGLFRHLAINQVARGLKIHQRNLRLQQRRLHPLALAGLFTFGQRHQYTGRRVQPC